MTKNTVYKIIINAQEVEVSDKKLTYEQVVRLAFPEMGQQPEVIFTVSFRKSDHHKHEGVLIEGESVNIKNGTIFDVTSTTKS